MWYLNISYIDYIWPDDLSEEELRISSGPLMFCRRSLIFSTEQFCPSFFVISPHLSAWALSQFTEFSLREDKSLDENLLLLTDWEMLHVDVFGCKTHPVTSVFCFFSGCSTKCKQNYK